MLKGARRHITLLCRRSVAVIGFDEASRARRVRARRRRHAFSSMQVPAAALGHSAADRGSHSKRARRVHFLLATPSISRRAQTIEGAELVIKTYCWQQRRSSSARRGAMPTPHSRRRHHMMIVRADARRLAHDARD